MAIYSDIIAELRKDKGIQQEAFVIQTHIIDGLDWPCVIAEHIKRWGLECIKTDRTLKSYNRHALQKMAFFMKEILTSFGLACSSLQMKIKMLNI